MSARTAVAAERTQPKNLEAERAVLGAILIHGPHLHQALEVLEPRDFYRDAHRRILGAMIALSERAIDIDFVTLREELTRTRELDEVGGPAYLAALADGVPRATNVAHYARIIKEKATRRALIRACTQVLTAAYEADEDLETVLDQAEQAIFAVADRRTTGGFEGMDVLVQSQFGAMERLLQGGRLITGVPSGFVELDEMTRGFQAGDLVIVAARPSMGKTSLVLNIADYVSRSDDQVVGFFSLEMSKEALFLRLLCGAAAIDSHRLMSGAVGAKDYARLSHALESLSRRRLYIDDTANVSVLEMRAKARRLKAEHGLSLLVVDYIQLMSARGKFDTRTLELAAISRSLKALAKELAVPILVLSQLSRAPETRSDHRPLLSDLRESGALEQDADVVVLIYRDEVYHDRDEANAGVAELIVAKQRNGPTGTVRLAFVREQTRFANLAQG